MESTTGGPDFAGGRGEGLRREFSEDVRRLLRDVRPLLRVLALRLLRELLLEGARDRL